jgi:hypothetical protein
LLTGIVVFGHESQPLGEGQSYDGGWGASYVIHPSFLDETFPSVWNGDGEGKTRLLYKDYEAVHGAAYVPRHQQSMPSCVGHATAAAVDILACVEIHSLNHRERAPPGRIAACVIYGLSRQEIGEFGPLSGGGSYNRYAARAIQEYGVVAHQRYPHLAYDLSAPSTSLCATFGREGVPESIERLAKQHPVHRFIKINSFTQLRDAIQHGCPVIIGSNVGFGSKEGRTRDEDGFLNPPRRMFAKSVWNHSMVAVAVCDSGRKGALILNSWGPDWISGPKKIGDEPEGSFWADMKIVDRMLKQGDSYALCLLTGWSAYRVW